MVALFVALGGTGYAAMKLPANSVGAKQIKKNAVRSAEVKNRSLVAKDFKKGQLPRGARGRRGAPGAPGAPGARYFATIDGATGAVRSGTATSAARPATGKYNVRFGPDLSRCSAIVTIGWNDADATQVAVGKGIYTAFPGHAWTPVMGLESAPTAVAVEFRGLDDSPIDTDFHIAVFC